jgi:hypothetical protein
MERKKRGSRSRGRGEGEGRRPWWLDRRRHLQERGGGWEAGEEKKN